ncbi:MAG TPA: TetR family transcriptional regulator [Pseudonocardiaceae bacterium]|jgi:AcrR family transcriptional regulator|nr:TetR family transcriptional regulator [Pseudonocardiaceae bacterium]
MDGSGGLRERKKRETRRRISNIATGLFMARGFDNVTVAEIAEAANVSKMTVFNYFPRKEELFFDRGEEAVELLHEAIDNRQPGESLITALRGLVLDLLAKRHPLSGLLDGIQVFWQVVRDSPALQAGAREMVDQLEVGLAKEFAEASGAAEHDPLPALAAALVIATIRTLYQTVARRLMVGERADDLYPEQVALANKAFDLLDAALDGF